MAVTTTSRLGLTRWSAGTDPFTRAQMDASMAAIETNAAMYAQGTTAARPAFGKAGRFYAATDAAAEAATVWYDTGTAWIEVRPNLAPYATDTDLTNGLAGKANSSHTHAAADINSGVLAVARLGSGTPSASTYLRGDGAWTTFPTQALSALTDTTISSPAAGHFLQWDTGTSKWVNSTITTAEVVNLDTALAGKAASSHTHAIGDLPVAASGTSNTTQLVRADDSRLSNARTPTAHTHAIGDLPVATSGTSSSTQVVRADDSRLSDARTPVAHTHVMSDLPDAWLKRTVRVASTANVAIPPGGTALTIDGVALANNDRVLLKDQTTTSQNGIYYVGGIGSSVTLTRVTDMDTAAEAGGATVSIDQGTQGGQIWTTTFKTTDALGTTAMLWYRVTDSSLMAANGGTTAGTWVQANDSRLSNARTPTAHTHAAADVNSGTLDIARLPVATSGTSNTTSVVRADDARLSDARTPVAHAHAGTDITSGTVDIARLPVASSGTSNTTQVVRADDSRLSNARTPTAHTHAAADVNSGTLDIARLPVASSGTSNTTQVVRADDSRLSNARTPVAHTHVLTDLPSAWVKMAARVATTANITLSGTQTIDGVAVAAGDRVLVKDQTTSSQNGLYTVSASTWTRTVGGDTNTDIAGGTVSIDQGTAHGGQIWTTTFKSTDTLGTTAMPWYKVVDTSQMAANGGTTAGTWVQANDSRLSNARTPTAHTHAQSDVTNLTTDLAAKAAHTDATLTRPTLVSPSESTSISGTAYGTTVTFDARTSGIAYSTAAATANMTVNFRGDASTTMNTHLSVGESWTGVLMITNGATAYYPTAWQIDGAAVTPKWAGGKAPTGGSPNMVDAYQITIIKTAATPTYTVLASAGGYK